MGASSDKIILPDNLVSGKLIYSGEKIKLGEFEFNKRALESKPILLFSLLFCLDPTPKQKEILEKIGVTFTDDNGKVVFPVKTDSKDNI